VTVQNRTFFTYLYLDNTTGMTHLKTVDGVTDHKVMKDHNECIFIYLLGLPDPGDEGTRSFGRLETINPRRHSNIAEDSSLQQHCCEKPKSHINAQCW